MRICGTTKAGVRRRFIAVRTDIRLEEKHRVSEVLAEVTTAFHSHQ